MNHRDTTMQSNTPLQLNASTEPYLHELLVIDPVVGEKFTSDATTPVFIFDT